MWLAEKSAGRSEARGESFVGVVTIGGERPSVLAEGELRSAELLESGAVRLPKIGDEVLLVKTADGDCVALGRVGGALPAGAENGEIVLSGGNSSLMVKNDGKIVLSGDIELTGTISIDGTLLINGQAYVPASSNSDSGTGTGA